jgi:hypothetical protein
VQIGPRALGLAAVMTKQMGLSLDNARQMLALARISHRLYQRRQE